MSATAAWPYMTWPIQNKSTRTSCPAASPVRTISRCSKAGGYDLVVNLRTPAEEIDFDEASAVRALGMTYVQIPVGVPDGLSADNAAQLNEALANSKGPALVHCASGNRAGALLALRAYYHQNASPEDALDLGRRAGVTRLEDSLRERLGLTDETQEPQ